MSARRAWLLALVLSAACSSTAPPPPAPAPPGPALPACRAWGFGWGSAVDVSADGALVAVGGDSGVVQLFGAADGQALRRFFDHGKHVFEVRFSPDGAVLATASCCEPVKLWRVKDGALLHTVDDSHRPMAFSHDGRLLVSSSRDVSRVVVSTVEGGARVFQTSPTVFILAGVAFLSDGQSFRSLGVNGEIKTWSAADGQLRTSVSVMPRRGSLVLSPDGTRYATAGDGSVVVGDAETGATIAALPEPDEARLAFPRVGGKLIVVAIGSAHNARVWSLAEGATQPVVHGEANDLRLTAFALAGDGEVLFAAGSGSEVLRWELARPPAPQAPSQTGEIVHVALAPTPGDLIVVDEHGVDVRDAATGAFPLRHPSLLVNTAASSRAGDVLALGVNSKQVEVWRVAGDRNLHKVRVHETGVYTSVAVSADGLMVAAVGADGIIRRWSVADGAPLPELKQQGGINALRAVFAPDGLTLATGNYDRLTDNSETRLWRASTGELLRMTREGGVAVPCAFSPDGSLLAMCTGTGPLRLVEPGQGTVVRELQGPSGVLTATFSADGGTLAAGYQSGVVRAWRVTDGMLLHAPSAGGGDVRALAFSADGQTLFGGGRDEVVRAWCLPPVVP